MEWHIEKRKLTDLIPYKHNPRKITEKGKADLKKSIDKFGLAEPIVINTDNVIIGGHARYFVLQERGDTECECYVPERQLTEQECKELNIRLNKNIAGEFDWDILANEFELEDLKEWGFDDKELSLGFPQDIVEDEAPALDETKEPDSKLGEVYILGCHRLLCGDATKKEDVEKLMDGKKVDLLLTDPPYGVNLGEKNRFLNSFQRAGRNLNDIANDMLKGDELFDTLVVAFSISKENMKDDASFYVTAPQGGELGLMMMMMMMSAGLPVRHVLNWVKNSPTFSMGRLDYDYQHEPILYGWKNKHNFYGGGEHKKSVWTVDKPRSNKEHPTMKPIELMANAILNSTKEEDIVLDPFGGSGSTLIAAEQTGRTCYISEIDPKYCDVIRKRYENYVNGN
jgi:DNA modification methylase